MKWRGELNELYQQRPPQNQQKRYKRCGDQSSKQGTLQFQDSYFNLD